MKAKIISKAEIAAFLDSLIREYEVLAPVKQGDLIVFDRIASAGEARLDYLNSNKPPKGLVLPQAEKLFGYSGGEVRETLPEKKPRILFGVRPCDARSFTYLDKVFNEPRYQDGYFINRRDSLLVVSLGCTSPRATCFCNSVGGSPTSSQGSDLLLVDIGQEYVVQVVTDRGGKLLEGKGLKDASAEKLAQMEKAIKAAEAAMPERMQLEGLKANLDRSFDDPIWQPLTEKCIGCGICTYLCPTCYCFDIVDEGTDSEGARIRIWDSCQYPLFTLETSGVNPRPSSRERYRQRIMHKFAYTVDNEGMVGCVGCGRCVSECPVNLDIRQVVKALASQTEVAK